MKRTSKQQEKLSNLLLTLYRLSGQNFSDSFSVGLAGATQPDASDVKTQLPEVLGGCFFVMTTEFGTVLKEECMSVRQLGVKVSGLHKQPFPKKLIFFGTWMSRQMVANGKVLASFFIVCRRKLFFLVFCDRLGVGLTKSQKTDETEMFRTGLKNLAGSNDWNPGHSSLGHQMASWRIYLCANRQLSRQVIPAAFVKCNEHKFMKKAEKIWM
jgi:hypothetical protein